ncbi:unnamed protein product [Adineta steineri]|uniref:Uncharacterized protein n=1 Tax=Adineta steineri TaxID=433720 RepID=A0A813QQW8_9BILA|nr:unnamed protein product [Adineta steineri]CAF3901272.1 unnamed protein product [Adineta steineri]
MLLIQQQSSSFRVWTSRALMIYFRRALLFLVISSRQNSNNKTYLLEQETVNFNDAEDEEDILMITDESKSSLERYEIEKNLLNKYTIDKLFQGLNNSMINSTIDISLQSQITEQFEPFTESLTQDSTIEINENKVSHDFIYQKQQVPIEYHNQIRTLQPCDRYSSFTNHISSYPIHLTDENKTFKFGSPCLPSFFECYSSDDEMSSLSNSIQQNISHSSNDEDNNNDLLITSNIRVRLIANQRDIESTLIHNIQQKKSHLKFSSITSNKKFLETSIL